MSEKADYFSDLQRQLDKLKIERGWHVMVHSALRHIGGRAARPPDLVRSLVERVGAEAKDEDGAGCLLMPTYPNTVPLEAYLYSDPLFDPRSTPSQAGGLTQVFMETTSARRSYHPWLAVSALGAGALDYLSRHHLSPVPYSMESPFYKLTQNPKAYLLFLGAHPLHNPTQRVLECVKWPDYPYKLFLDEPLTLRYLDYEGLEHKMLSYVPWRRYLPRFARWAEDFHAAYPEFGQSVTSDLGYTLHLYHAPTYFECQQRAYERGMFLHNRYYSGRPARWREAIINLKDRLGIKKRLGA